jgi:anti-sigma factor RsiW
MSMENTRDLPLEVRLSAYLDGQLDDAETREIEALLKSDAEARALLDMLKAGSEFGNAAFDEMLRAPVPLALVRAVRTPQTGGATSGGAPLRAANSNVASFFRFIPQAIAASAVLLLAGGYTGYFVGSRNADQDRITETSGYQATAETAPKTRSMSPLTVNAPAADGEQGSTRSFSRTDVVLSDIAAIHRIYAADATHADEVPASRQSELVGYLEAVTSVTFAVPDLSAEGYRLRGGRLVVAVGQPTGALLYENDKGAIAAVYFMKNEGVTGIARAQDGFAVIGGQKATTSYFIAAPDEATARAFETSVQAAL